MDVPKFIAGRFRIEREIGTGGMGTVYLATHLGLERAVAVKIIKPEFAGDSDVADRFLREARTMAKLRHQHAAMIFDAGNLPDGRHFIIMEFIEGETLSEALLREGRFAAQQAVCIATQICDVFAEAHRIGIIHRDLKPSNIMLNERGVCVLDFGVAKVLASSAESTATHASTGSGQIVGTPRYMSPEQCLGQRVGARSDLYSLGVLLYEMLTGRPPFVDPLPSAVLVKQATAPPPPLPHLRPDIPRPLALAVHTLLAKRPEDRPRTATIAKALLERSLNQSQYARPEVDPLSSTVASVNHGRSLLFRVGAPLVLVLMLGALFALGYTGESASEIKNLIPQFADASIATVPGVPVTYRETTNAAAGPVNRKDSRSTLEQARKTASALTKGTVSAVQIVDTDSGPAIVAVQSSRTGEARFVVFEKSRGRYAIASKGTLTDRIFAHGSWTTETVDADEDGYNEILFSGKDTKDGRTIRKLVLLVPNDRRTYSMLLNGEITPSGNPRILWLANAVGTDAAAYRTALRRKARALLNVRQR